MIAEFFGLSKSGKSTLKRRLEQEGQLVLKMEDKSRLKKLFFFIKYLLLQPHKTLYLFYKLNTNYAKIEKLSIKNYFRVFLMRNSYLTAVLSKHEMIKNTKELVFVDEFSLQSLFMIIQKKSNKQEIESVLNILPKADYIFLFERNRKKRHEAYKLPHKRIANATLLPASWLDMNYALHWMNIMEHNYEIIKKTILENYKKDNKDFKSILKKAGSDYIKNELNIYKSKYL